MTNTETDIAERFKRETAGHQMAVLHDSGLYRHLRFRNPEHGIHGFDLITWPGCLTIRGDIGAYVFSRLPDMFEAFRNPSGDINPHDWAEQLDSGRDAVLRYDEDLFRKTVKEHAAQDIRDGTPPRGTGRAVAQFLKDWDTAFTDESSAREALEEFEFARYEVACSCGEVFAGTDRHSIEWDASRHDAEGGAGHTTSATRVDVYCFRGTWEWDFRGYDWRFLWACHAIVWGIARYDEAKGGEQR